MAYTEILTGHGLTVEQWDSQIASEYIGQLWMKNIMGESSDAVIQVKRDLMKQPGDAITVGLRSQLIGGYVAGNSWGLGNEGRVDFFSQRIVIDNVRHLVRFDDIPMSQKRVGWDLLNQGREALVEKARIRLDQDIVTALSTTTSGKVAGRALYGASTANYSGTHATDLANVDNTSDQLTTDIVRITKRLAVTAAGAQAKIRPMKVKMGMNFEEYYIYVAHPYAIRDLVSGDAAYRNAMLLTPPMSNEKSPLFTGSAFKGNFDGVLIYEYEGIQLANNTNSVQCSTNLFMGAQAGAVVWGQMPKFGDEDQDIGHTVSYEVHEIRNQALLVFDRNSVDGTSNETNGLIWSFTAAVAD